jgi:argininosuccinate lyase
LWHGFRHGLSALELVPDLLAGMRWKPAAMRAAIDPAMHATDIAIEAAVAGVPFRDAYRSAAANADEVPSRTPEQSLAARVSPGAAADPRHDRLRERLAALHL